MSMNVFELFAKLGLDTSEYDKGLSDASSGATSFASVLTTGVGVAAGVATTAIAATTAATVAGSKAFIDGANDVASYGDEIDKTSQKLGLSTDAYQEWDYVLNIAGTSMSNMTTGVKTLTNKIDDAKNGSEDAIAMFEQLGISLEDLETMSREDIFEATIYGFTELEDSTERAALANDLFGRSGQELTPLFNMTEEEISSLIDTANEYGMVMSEDAVKASAEYTDSLTTLENTITGLKNNLMSQFLPSMSTVMDGLSAIFAGDESGLGLVESGVNDFVDNLGDILPDVIRIGSSILVSLGSAITSNLPVLIDAGFDAVSTLIDGILDNSDLLLDCASSVINTITDKLLDETKAGKLTQAAVDILVKLGDSIADALPVLVPSIVSVLKTIVETLTTSENLAMLLDVALEIVNSLSYSIVQIAPEITNIILPLLLNVATAIAVELPDIIETLFNVLASGIVAGGESLLGLFGLGWEDFKAYFALFGVDASNFLESMLVSAILWFDDAWDFISTWFGNAIDGLGNFVADIIEWIVNLGTSVWSNISSFFTNASSTVLSFNSKILGYITGGIDNIKDYVSAGLEAVESTFTNIFDNVKNTVENSINFIKGLFDFEWSLPDIKLPHFTISGSLDLLASPPSIPTVGVEWYAKAMNQPYLLDSATIFGASGGKLLGGGERGNEMIYGHDQLMSDIASVVDSRLTNLELVANIYIGGKKIDQQIVMANARNDVISGGR